MSSNNYIKSGVNPCSECGEAISDTQVCPFCHPDETVSPG